MATAEVHPRIREAIVSWMRGEAPLVMDEIAPLPVTLADGIVKPFGQLTPDELGALAGTLKAQAMRNYEAVKAEWSP